MAADTAARQRIERRQQSNQIALYVYNLMSSVTYKAILCTAIFAHIVLSMIRTVPHIEYSLGPMTLTVPELTFSNQNIAKTVILTAPAIQHR